MKTIYWVIGVVAVSVSVFIYLLLGDAQKTVPKIKVSYFDNETEIAEAVTQILSQVLSTRSTFWIGVEPGHNEQLEVALQLKQRLQKAKPFTKVIVDEELSLSKDWLEKFEATDSVAIKNNLSSTGTMLAELEKSNQPYVIITANIYATPSIMGNSIHKMKEKFSIKPTTFSLAFFPTVAAEEKDMVFPCRTEDNAGTAGWGCIVANKARFTRRKIDPQNQKSWVGLMDLIGEQDYMILLKKR